MLKVKICSLLGLIFCFAAASNGYHFTISIRKEQGDKCQLSTIFPFADGEKVIQTYRKDIDCIFPEPKTIFGDFRLLIADQIWDEFCTYKIHGPIVNVKTNDTLQCIEQIKVARELLKFTWIDTNTKFAIANENIVKIADLKNDNIIKSIDVEHNVIDLKWDFDEKYLIVMTQKGNIGINPFEVLKFIAGHPVLYYDFFIFLYDINGEQIKRVKILKNVFEGDINLIQFVQ
jgi:hypothetical protein